MTCANPESLVPHANDIILPENACVPFPLIAAFGRGMGEGIRLLLKAR